MLADWSLVQNYLKKVVLIVLVILIIVGGVRFFIAEPGRVDGQSMEPNFYDYDSIVVNKLIYLLRPPRRTEIVQLVDSQKPEQPLVKRIIGLPGETVVFKDKAVYLQIGQELTLLDEPYLAPNTVTNFWRDRREFVIPDNYYLVLGDNRANSQDSRHFGLIHRRQIIGRVSKW